MEGADGSHPMLLVKKYPSNVISDQKRTTFFCDVIGYRILFSDKKPIPEMILVSKKKPDELVMIIKSQLVCW